MFDWLEMWLNIGNILRAQRNCFSPEAAAQLASFLSYPQTFAFAPFYYHWSVNL